MNNKKNYLNNLFFQEKNSKIDTRENYKKK